MTRVNLKHATEPLSKYALKARKGAVVVMKSGKPFAAVVSMRNADEETLALSLDRKFLAIIERSRARMKKEGGIPAREMRRRLKLRP